MNIIIFGTGTIYKEQIDKVQDSIVTLADNSKYKIGTIIDGKRLYHLMIYIGILMILLWLWRETSKILKISWLN